MTDSEGFVARLARINYCPLGDAHDPPRLVVQAEGLPQLWAAAGSADRLHCLE
jgi:hypothetical protein